MAGELLLADCAPGTTVVVTKRGFVPATVVRDASTRQVVLDHGEMVEVHCHLGDGSPVSGATVAISGRPLPSIAETPAQGSSHGLACGPADSCIQVEATDEDGIARCSGLLPGRIQVRARKVGFMQVILDPVLPSLPGSVVRVEMARLFGAAVRIRGGSYVTIHPDPFAGASGLHGAEIDLLVAAVQRELAADFVWIFAADPALPEARIRSMQLSGRILAEGRQWVGFAAPIHPVESLLEATVVDVEDADSRPFGSFRLRALDPDGIPWNPGPIEDRLWIRGMDDQQAPGFVMAARLGDVHRLPVITAAAGGLRAVIPAMTFLVREGDNGVVEIPLRHHLVPLRFSCTDDSGTLLSHGSFSLDYVGSRLQISCFAKDRWPQRIWWVPSGAARCRIHCDDIDLGEQLLDLVPVAGGSVHEIRASGRSR